MTSLPSVPHLQSEAEAMAFQSQLLQKLLNANHHSQQHPPSTGAGISNFAQQRMHSHVMRDEDSDSYDDSDSAMEDDSDSDSDMDDEDDSAAMMMGGTTAPHAPASAALNALLARAPKNTTMTSPSTTSSSGGGNGLTMFMKTYASSPALQGNRNMNVTGSMCHHSNSMTALTSLQERMHRCHSNYMQPVDFTSAATIAKLDSNANNGDSMKPQDLLHDLILAGDDLALSKISPQQWQDYFLTIQEHHVTSYTAAVERAVRDGNLAELQRMLDAGHDLNCCNRHGESILHIACRRGSMDLLTFLLTKAKVNPRIRDDVLRTAAHDLCWSHTPNFGLVLVLARAAPELWFCPDIRGFCPLQYCPRATWPLWCDFIRRHQDLFRDMKAQTEQTFGQAQQEHSSSRSSSGQQQPPVMVLG